mgnify:CR=1 FL=1
MAANTPVTNIKQKAQDAVVQALTNYRNSFLATWNVRGRLEDIDRAYLREQDFTEQTLRSKAAARGGDPTKFRNIQVPVVYSSVESAVTYQTSVFLTGIPLFGVSSSAQHMDAALQMETIIDNQATRGGWVRELQMMFRDGFKYTFGACEVKWAEEKTYKPETDLAFSKDQAKAKEVIYAGNKLERIDPYNAFWDTRYSLADMPKRGEFAGYTKLLSRSELIRHLDSLPVSINSAKAKSCSSTQVGTAAGDAYYVPNLNPEALLDNSNPRGEFNWSAWAGLSGKSGQQFANSFILTTLYLRLVPSDFGLPSAAQHETQIWKFEIINDQIMIYAERLTNLHDMIPILFIQPNEDGLSYQSKSLASNALPFQEVASALVNSSIHARRRAISDRGIYDPSRISTKEINNESSSAKIPVKPAMYGRPLAEAYMPIPYRDEQSQHAMGDMQVMLSLNEQAVGLNKAQQGQFVKGNKTLFEYQDVMASANARPQSVSLLLEAQFFTPLKELLKLNVLQYQTVAEMYNRETETVVSIDPLMLRNASLSFKVSDGVTPAAKQMNTEAFASACQTLAALPQLAGQYNLGPMFSYLFKMQRADIGQFEKSPQLIQYEQAVAAWQGSVQMLAEQLAKLTKADGSSYTPEELTKALPPQPMPEQFGLDPQNPYAPLPKSKETVMQQFAAKEQTNAAAQ